MTTAIITLTGRLGSAPECKQGPSGKDWSRARLAVDLPENRDKKATQWFSLVAFGPKAKDLAKHRKGDVVSVVGELRLNRWLKNGEDHTELQIVVKQVTGVRSVASRNGPSDPKNTRSDDIMPNWQPPVFEGPQEPDFDDPIPF